MNRCRFVRYLLLITLLVPLSSPLIAQSYSELIISGTIHYGGRHTGMVHIVAVDSNDILSFDAQPESNDLPFAAHTTITEPGPYSLSIPHALPGRSYEVLAQMDIDGSGFLSMKSFQQYEPSGHYSPCALGDCSDPEDILSDSNDPGSISLGRSPILDASVYLSDYEPCCMLVDTFDAVFLSFFPAGMDYHDGCLWICQPLGAWTVVHQVNSVTGDLIASHDLGDGDAIGIEWIDDDMWLCCWEPTSWTVRQYIYDGHAFTQGVSYLLPSSTDWEVIHGVHIAWDGTVLWIQEQAHCGQLHKLDLSDGLLPDVVSECDFTYNKWLGLNDIADICLSDGYLWAMNDSSATFAKISPNPNQLPPETHYTFAFDPNSHILDRGHGEDTASYAGMVKQGDLVYFIESMKIRDANNTVIDRRYRIHTARIEQDDQRYPNLSFNLSGQYWFVSLSVDVDTNAPWAKRGTVSIIDNQWHQKWEDYNGKHEFSSTFTTTVQSDGSININFEEETNAADTYNVAWNGDVMIHAGSVLHEGGEGIDFFTHKATNVDVNDVLGEHGFFGHYLGIQFDSCVWANLAFDPNGTATWENPLDITESDTMTWTLDDANAVAHVFGPTINPDEHAALFFGKRAIGFECHVAFEEGRDKNDLGYSIFMKKSDELITTADIAGHYHVRFFQTGPGSVPYTCGQGYCVIEAVDDANGILFVDAYYSNGHHDVRSIDCSVGPGNELQLDDVNTPNAIVSLDKNLIFVPSYRNENLPTRTPDDWLGGIFLVRIPNNITDPNSWVVEPPMNVARRSFTGGVINGRICVFGGNTDGTHLKSTEMYNPATKQWVMMAENNHNNFGTGGVEELTSAVVNDKLYVFGAYGGIGPDGYYGVFNFNEMYDPLTDTWTTLAEKPTTVSMDAATVYNNEIYLFGGNFASKNPSLDHDLWYSVVESYDPSSNKWRHVTDIPLSMQLFGIATVGTKAYLFGGIRGNEWPDVELLDSVITYDFQSDTWTTTGYQPMPVKKLFRYSNSAPVIDGKIYLIGVVEDAGGEFVTGSRVDIYDPATNSWHDGTPLPMPLAGHVSLSIDGRIYVIGGSNSHDFESRSKAEVISLDTNTRSQ